MHTPLRKEGRRCPGSGYLSSRPWRSWRFFQRWTDVRGGPDPPTADGAGVVDASSAPVARCRQALGTRRWCFASPARSSAAYWRWPVWTALRRRRVAAGVDDGAAGVSTLSDDSMRARVRKRWDRSATLEGSPHDRRGWTVHTRSAPGRVRAGAALPPARQGQRSAERAATGHRSRRHPRQPRRGVNRPVGRPSSTSRASARRVGTGAGGGASKAHADAS